jgi:hypothetical protein
MDFSTKNIPIKSYILIKSIFLLPDYKKYVQPIKNKFKVF